MAAKISGQTVSERFLNRTRAMPDLPAYYHHDGKGWKKAGWGELGILAARLGVGLHDLGHGRGEKCAILADTRPEWTVCDYGILGGGGVSVGVYPTLTIEQTEYVIDHSDSTTLIVQDQAQLEKILRIKSKLPKVKRIIVWEKVDRHQDDRIIQYEDVLKRGETLLEKDRESFARLCGQAKPGDLAIIIYTSGTTGPPKGAMMSHGNICFMLDAMNEILPIVPEDQTIAFLPMAHVAEHVVGQFGRLQTGMSAYYARSLQTVVDDLAAARPTVFGSVPRIFEKVYSKVQSGLEQAPPGKRRMAEWAIGTALEYSRLQREGRAPGMWLSLKRAVADRLVLKKLRGIFGGQVRFFISGAAPIAYEILEFFDAAGMTTYEVYGMTESTALITANRPGAQKLGTVGKAIPHVEVKIAEDGEILARGPNVFLGYFKNEEATRETIDAQGWLHTGDIGEMDEEGFLRITDRKKNLIITAGGKNIAPANIEGLLKQDPLISQVLVHGDKRKFLSALFTLEPEEAGKFAQQNGLKPDDRRALAKHPALLERIRKHVEACNEQLARYETVKKWEILAEDFTVDNEMLTPTLKVRRKQVEQRYNDLLESFYAGAGGD